MSTRRRISSILFAAFVTASLAAPMGAFASGPGDPVVEPPTPEVLPQAELDLVVLVNRQRTNADLVPYRVDPDLMAIARDRALVMAANDIMDHTEPDGRKVWDRLSDANVIYFAGAEMIAWNNWPVEWSAAEAVAGWMASPGHHDAIVSHDYNYAGFGAAISATGKRYYAGLFVKEPDETGAMARFGTIEAIRRPSPHACDAPLVGRGPEAPGHDRRAPLLPGRASPGRWHLALLGRHDRDPPNDHVAQGVRPPSPRPRSRPSRQLGPLEGRQHQPLTFATVAVPQYSQLM